LETGKKNCGWLRDTQIYRGKGPKRRGVTRPPGEKKKEGNHCGGEKNMKDRGIKNLSARKIRSGKPYRQCKGAKRGRIEVGSPLLSKHSGMIQRNGEAYQTLSECRCGFKKNGVEDGWGYIWGVLWVKRSPVQGPDSWMMLGPGFRVCRCKREEGGSSSSALR